MRISKEYSLEKDMETCDWFKEKLANKGYAQNVYAAMCNNRFFKISDSLAILTDDSWSCTWRYAGGVIARLRNRHEDYLDYYCSGMTYDLTLDLPLVTYVEESVVTDEVREDILKIGWIIKPYD